MKVCFGHKPSNAAALAVVPCLLALGQVAAAAEPATDILEEVVVSAQKRLQNAQDVGVSITALGKDALALLGTQDAFALGTRVPSLQIQQFTPKTVILNIRGVSQNDIGSSQEAPIAFYNDEVYIAPLGAISGQNFDLERIEVLRGPQGTLFGRNATGGLVQVITARPTREFEGRVQVGTGSFGQFTSDAAISGPLTDTLRGRLALSSNRHDGYIERSGSGPDGARANFYGGRGQLEADLGTGRTLRFKVEYLRNDNETPGPSHLASGFDSDGLGFAVPENMNFWGPGGPGYPALVGGIFGPVLTAPCLGCDALGYRENPDHLKSDNSDPGFFSRKYGNITVRYDQDLGFGQLTSISNYQNLKVDFGTNAAVSSVGPPFDVADGLASYQYSQELRLAGATDRHNWVAGVYGLKLHHNSFVRVGTLPGTPLPNQFSAFYDAQPTTRSAAAFGQDEIKLTEVFSLIAGIRYTADWKKDDYINMFAPPFTPAFPALVFNPSTDERASRSFRDVSGKLELDAKPAEGTLLYLSISRGTKAGGFGTPTFPPVTADIMNYGKESLTNYEAGYKLTLADRKATLNGALFHYDYRNYQAFSNLNLAQVITNHPAELNGAEVEATVRPVSSVRLNVFATRLFTARVEDMVMPFGRVTDRRMPQAPNWSFGGSASYELPIHSGVFQFATNWKYDGAQYLTAFNAPIDREAARAIGDVRVSFAANSGSWEAAAFVNNVTNKVYRSFNFDFGTALGLSEAYYAPPRWYGANVTYYFARH